jgi:spore maturation protein CgeB
LPTETVLLVPTVPPKWTSNAVLIDLLKEACSQRFGPEGVRVTSPERAPRALQELRPRFVLVFGSLVMDEVDLGPLRAAGDEPGVKVAYWATEDPYELDAAYKLEGVADVIFTNDRFTKLHYELMGFPHVHHLPLAASIRQRRPVLERDGDYLYDVFFCGVAFDNRRKVIDGLRPLLSGVNALICGSHWNENARWIQNRRLSPEELLDAYQHSRIVLNVGRTHSFANDRFAVTPSTPGPRTFEAAIAGGAQLAFADRPEILDYYMLGEEISMFDSLSEAEATVDRLLAHPEERIAMAIAAQRRTERSHLYIHRMDAMLDVIGAR